MAEEGPARDKKTAAAEGGVVLFEDECIFQQSGTIHRTWAAVGVGAEVRSKPLRRSCKVYGAVSVDPQRPKFHFRFEAEKFNAYTFVTFLEGLVRYYSARGRRIHLILDGAAYHKAALPWVNAHQKHIELHFLPGYSPNLNAAEQIWRRTKHDATHNRYFPYLGPLHDALFRRFNRFQGNPAALRGLIERFL